MNMSGTNQLENVSVKCRTDNRMQANGNVELNMIWLKLNASSNMCIDENAANQFGLEFIIRTQRVCWVMMGGSPRTSQWFLNDVLRLKWSDKIGKKPHKVQSI